MRDRCPLDPINYRCHTKPLAHTYMQCQKPSRLSMCVHISGDTSRMADLAEQKTLEAVSLQAPSLLGYQTDSSRMKISREVDMRSAAATAGVVVGPRQSFAPVARPGWRPLGSVGPSVGLSVGPSV